MCSTHLGLLLRAHILNSDSKDCSDLLPFLGAAAAASPAAVCTPVLNCLQVPTPVGTTYATPAAEELHDFVSQH
jgi:hypothetical protein